MKCATAIASPAEVNATPVPKLTGSVAGLVNLVPKPLALHGYAVTKGVVVCATAMASPVEVNATLVPPLAGSVAGLANLVPKPEPDHGYAETKGVVVCATAIYSCDADANDRWFMYTACSAPLMSSHSLKSTIE